MNSIFIYSNFISQEIRDIRHISTDSPAANKKILNLAKDLSINNNVSIVSLGRTSSSFTLKTNDFHHEIINGIKIYYAKYFSFYFLSYLVSFFSLLFITMAVTKSTHCRKKNIHIFYNRHPLYLLTLFYCFFSGDDCVLDLEDGERLMPGIINTLKFPFLFLMKYIFDSVCSKCLVATTNLCRETSINACFHYCGSIYKSENKSSIVTNETVTTINFLYCGTIEKNTGSSFVIDFIRLSSILKYNFAFYITGRGSDFNQFIKIKNELNNVFVFENLDLESYENLLNKIDFGFSLKDVNGIYADSTFPSKIIEFLNYNILPISTELQDVKYIFEEYIVYTNLCDTEILIDKINNICNEPQKLQSLKSSFINKGLENLEQKQVIQKLQKFLL